MTRAEDKRTFWTAYFASLAVLVLTTVTLLAVGRGGDFGTGAMGTVVVLGGLVAAFACTVYGGAVWGGRYGVYGALAGFLGTLAVLMLVVTVCAFFVLRSFS